MNVRESLELLPQPYRKIAEEFCIINKNIVDTFETAISNVCYDNSGIDWIEISDIFYHYRMLNGDLRV